MRRGVIPNSLALLGRLQRNSRSTWGPPRSLGVLSYWLFGNHRQSKETYMWAIFLGAMRRSGPTRAFPVALTRFSPLEVSGMSVKPVWRPSSDHSVSPWRIRKTRGVDMFGMFETWWQIPGIHLNLSHYQCPVSRLYQACETLKNFCIRYQPSFSSGQKEYDLTWLWPGDGGVKRTTSKVWEVLRMKWKQRVFYFIEFV